MRRRWRGPVLGICSVIFVQVVLYLFISTLNQAPYDEEYRAVLQKLSNHSHRPAAVNATLKPIPAHCTQNAALERSLDSLLKVISSVDQWKWIINRISTLWPTWVRTAENQIDTAPVVFGRKLRILVVPGIFIATDFADANRISRGGPLGDLVQWADLIAALHLLGHNVTLEWDVYQSVRGLRYDKFLESSGPGCPSTGMDLIFTDIIAVKTFPPDVLRKCRIRVLDAYGTEAMYNHPKYSLKHGYNSPYYGRLGLDLRQFLTFYPHTPENTFLGFVVPPSAFNISIPKKKSALIYGKSARYFEGHFHFLEHLVKLGLEVYATVDNATQLPVGVKNLGILKFEEYQQLLSQSNYFVGLGEPLESTAAIEALSHGCIFINPKFSSNQSQWLQQMGKPTSRHISSQVPYLEKYVGPPHVYTVNISNDQEIAAIIKKTINNQHKPFIPSAFTMQRFLQRISIYVHKQDFCRGSSKPPIWPPLSASIPVFGRENQSCSDACSSQGLVCEYSFFRTVNTKESYQKLNISCSKDPVPMEGLLYPAHLVFRDVCALQPDPLLFSCAGKHPDIQRLCPCREYVKEQPSICRQCL